MQLRSLTVAAFSFAAWQLSASSFQSSAFSFELGNAALGCILAAYCLASSLQLREFCRQNFQGSLVQLMGKASSFHSRLRSLDACSEQLGAINLQL